MSHYLWITLKCQIFLVFFFSFYISISETLFWLREEGGENMNFYFQVSLPHHTQTNIYLKVNKIYSVYDDDNNNHNNHIQNPNIFYVFSTWDKEWQEEGERDSVNKIFFNSISNIFSTISPLLCPHHIHSFLFKYTVLKKPSKNYGPMFCKMGGK